MFSQSRAIWRRVGCRCLVPAVAAFLAASAALPWSTVAQQTENSPIHQSSTIRPVTGLVVGPDGKPVAAAQVYLFAGKDWSFGVFPKDWPKRLPKDAWTVERQMEYRLRKPRWRTLRRAGPRLLVFAEGLGFGYERLFAYDLFDVRLRDAFDPGLRENMQDVRIRLPEMMPIRGRLLTPDGLPAQGVLVSVRQLGEDQDLVLCQCRLDLFGRSVAGSPGASAELEPRQQLQLANRHAPEFWPSAVLTDADGRFRLDGMPLGWPVHLTLAHPEFAQQALVVHTNSKELAEHRKYACLPVPSTFTHTLKPARPPRGVVRAADTGKPLSGVLLWEFSVSTNAFWHGSGCVFVRTDRQGRYRLNCHEWKDYSPSLYPPPDSGYLAMNTRIEDGPKGPVKDIRLDRGVIIRGRVLDGETEAPIPGASVVYRPSRANSSHKQHYLYQHPVLTDTEGRFAMTGLSGPGYLLAETADRAYLRSANVGQMLSSRSARPKPSGLTEINVPANGPMEKEVVIRLKRGRTVTLQAVGPKGEALPWVEAEWQGNYSAHDLASNRPRKSPRGKVVVNGLDPDGATRVFLVRQPARLAAVFNLTPETKEGPVEVRLQPTATIVGELITPGGKPSAGYVELFTSFAPEVSQFTQKPEFPDRVRLAGFCVGGEHENLHANPDGRFTVKNVMPGVPIGLALGELKKEGRLVWEANGSVISLQPLAPGERRDLGRLTVGQPRSKPSGNVQMLLLLAGRIGIVPDLSELGKDRPPKVQVLPGNAADKAGVRSGDRIIALNGRPIKRMEDVLGIWNQLNFDKGLRLSLMRDGKKLEVTLPAELFQDPTRSSGSDAP